MAENRTLPQILGEHLSDPDPAPAQTLLGADIVNFAPTAPAALRALDTPTIDVALDKAIEILQASLEEGQGKDVHWSAIRDVLTNMLKLNASSAETSAKAWLKDAAAESIGACAGEAHKVLESHAEALVKAFMDATLSVSQLASVKRKDQLEWLKRMRADAGDLYKIHSASAQRNDRLSKWLAIPMAIFSTLVTLLTTPTSIDGVAKATKHNLAIASVFVSLVITTFSVLMNNIEPGQKAGQHLVAATNYHHIRQSLISLLLVHSRSNISLDYYVTEYQARMSNAEKLCPLEWQDTKKGFWRKIIPCFFPIPKEVQEAHNRYHQPPEDVLTDRTKLRKSLKQSLRLLNNQPILEV